MLEHNQWLAGAVVLDGDTLGGGRGGDEKLVLALPAEPEHGGGGAVKAAQLAVALYQNTAVGVASVIVTDLPGCTVSSLAAMYGLP